ncbi:DNA repair exonuclease SbcCD ATPase subunit [Thermosporothrix hazakensis]|jgi:exonuclease SbcC|uniref:Nuclease SbcCD subunit C n=1 Tax=Thermosporothrix hazakensis TaxID=644383 RepID=A0A326U2H7_THEHA|nr:SMC family ATPase [Thermosporothrix hazakensis]PZW25623.1 DNA repair exonuclease SbcCD ATPase subunit [Thermosporothrix hazakensis]GCE48118.1 hypothetical protein KTH_29870 [Thermosporothrix hazakensis]
MLITRIELENIKSYHHFTVDLRRGTTAISGENGAGKTTLVEAIGFALFDYLPYSQSRFVREGEKWGRVTVHLIGGDERPYVVERRCGSGSRWFVYDEGANIRLEQSADVMDKLHELFGIDRSRPLASLFRDALGVPQGTFTSIFLETASKRKQTFDSLLQIEDYKTAAEYLLETQRQYKEQREEQEKRIVRLEAETQDLEAWRNELEEKRKREQEWSRQSALLTQQLVLLSREEEKLTAQHELVQTLEQKCRETEREYSHAQELLKSYELQLQQARMARQIVNENQESYQRYLEVEKALNILRQEQRRQSLLQQQLAEIQRSDASAQERLNFLKQQLVVVEQAKARVIELAPLVERQIELEQQREKLKQQITSFETVMREGTNKREQQENQKKKLRELEQKIARIEPLKAVAEKLNEYEHARKRLLVQENERKNIFQKIRDKQQLVQERKQRQLQVAERLHKVEQHVEAIEAHRAEAEEMPGLEARKEQLAARCNRLEGNIEGYARSRAQSAGGQCPLLHESCLNIKQRGIASLESYFEDLLQSEKAQLAKVRQEYAAVVQRIERVRKYAEALTKLDQYIQRRDEWADLSQELEREIAHHENEIAALSADAAMLKGLDQQKQETERLYQQSRLASEQISVLPTLYEQKKGCQELIDQLERELQDLRRKFDSLRESRSLLTKIEEELLRLDDPRAHSRGQREIIAKEETLKRQFAEVQAEIQQLQQQMHSLQQELAAYQSLDERVLAQEQELQHCLPGYQNYLKYIETAQKYALREQEYQRQQAEVEAAKHAFEEAQQASQQALAGFDRMALEQVRLKKLQLDRDLSSLAGEIRHLQEAMSGLQQRIAEGEVKQEELEAARKEYNELDELYGLTEYFRKLIKEAAPHVLKAMLNDISAEANRIFGEIMGDHSAQLSWQNEYEIVLRRQGVARTFAQLSGGEQMSAALAVRLALLKKLSTLNIAFFDEPTQNMDEMRRMNLAEQIRRVRGFEQLIVISHDDTFEQGLDSLIRVRKVHGETQLLDEDAVRDYPRAFEALSSEDDVMLMH